MGGASGNGLLARSDSGPGIVVQEFPNKMERPGIFRCEAMAANQICQIDPRLIGRDERRTPVWIARFCLNGTPSIWYRR